MKSIFLSLGLAFGLLRVVSGAADEGVGGIGLALSADKDTQALKIMKVVPKTPAANAGLKPGELVRKIGDTDVSGKSLTDCIALIRGPIGSKIGLEIFNPADQSTRKVELTREKLPAPTRARLGDAAAPLVIKEWVQGEPVKVGDGKTVYVVEFWATWCGPCRQSIPHLSKLQAEFKDKGVVVVGISDEEPDKVRPFVKQMGADMGYTVACDDSRQTYANYMDAYGYNGIPTAFVVGKDGRVIWHGHPMAGLDKALPGLLAKESTPAPQP